ncbi:LuxR C-terminal-related transcriptional regulator [Streptomyces cinereoruber]|uniref:LuxR C-terminal-related transcriptional regulator n=1 Tax=Streptomyces cinereoruber TaxID=67260 RepID=UPI00362BFA0D
MPHKSSTSSPSPADGRPGDHPARAYPRRNLTNPRTYVTARQVQVLRLAANGNTNRSIGTTLGIAEASVASQMQLLMRKLRVGDRAQAVAVALVLGLLTADDIKVPEGANQGYGEASQRAS